MARKTIVLAGAIFALTILAGSSFAADKFAYVDLSKIFSDYGKTKDYDKALGEKQGAFEADYEKMAGDVKKMQDKMNLLSDKEKESKKDELDNKIKSVQDFGRQKQTDLRKEQDEKMKEILKDIEETVKQYAEKEGYTMVFNDRVLVYQTKNLDITDKIIELVNKGYKKGDSK
jgi:outer membrane protein